MRRIPRAFRVPGTIGDGCNDVEMLGWAARSVAMANAPADVRDRADEVVDDVDSDGVAAVLSWWFSV